MEQDDPWMVSRVNEPLYDESDEETESVRTVSGGARGQRSFNFSDASKVKNRSRLGSSDINWDPANHMIIDASNNVVWTKSDQLRLQNIDELLSRMMEHHNNVHTRALWVNDSLFKSSRRFKKLLIEKMNLHRSPAGYEPVMAVMDFNVSSYQTGNLGEPATLTGEEAELYLAELAFDDPLWSTEERAAAKAWGNMARENRQDAVRDLLSAKLGRGGSSRASAGSKSSSSGKHKRKSDGRNAANDAANASTSTSVKGDASGINSTKNRRRASIHTLADLPMKDCLWIHMQDLSALEAVAGRFSLHDLVVTGFRDIRTSANFLPLRHAVFFCFCTFSMNKTTNEVSMFKVYLYISLSTNLVISFERQIMQKTRRGGGRGSNRQPHSGAEAVPWNPVASRVSVLDHEGEEEDDDEDVDVDGNGTMGGLRTEGTTAAAAGVSASTFVQPQKTTSIAGLSGVDDDDDAAGSKVAVICPAVMARYKAIYVDCLRLGGVHIVTTFALESLHCQDAVVEFMSRALLYIKRLSDTRVKLYYREKSFVAKQMVVLTKAMRVFGTNLAEGKYTFSTLQTFLRTGNFKVKELYITEEDERQEATDDVDTYREILRSRLKISTAGLGATTSGGLKSNMSSTTSTAASVAAGGVVGANLAGFFSIDLHDAASVHALMYHDFKDCHAFSSQQLDTMHIFMDEYNFSTSLLKEQQLQLKEIKETIDDREQLRGINMENLVALISASTLPMTFIVGAGGMNFRLERVFEQKSGAKWMVVICCVCIVSCILYFFFFGYIDLSARTWLKLLKTVTCYKHWCHLLAPESQKGIKRVVLRADGRLVGTRGSMDGVVIPRNEHVSHTQLSALQEKLGDDRDKSDVKGDQRGSDQPGATSPRSPSFSVRGNGGGSGKFSNNNSHNNSISGGSGGSCNSRRNLLSSITREAEESRLAEEEEEEEGAKAAAAGGRCAEVNLDDDHEKEDKGDDFASKDDYIPRYSKDAASPGNLSPTPLRHHSKGRSPGSIGSRCHSRDLSVHSYDGRSSRGSFSSGLSGASGASRRSDADEEDRLRYLESAMRRSALVKGISLADELLEVRGASVHEKL
jgi:Mg2+ and Co2+ transporter CorA